MITIDLCLKFAISREFQLVLLGEYCQISGKQRENADEIFFVNSNHVILAGSMDKAVELLMHDKGDS